MPLSRDLLLVSFSAAAALILAIVGLAVFNQSEWLTIGFQGPYQVWAGYTKGEFAALVFFIVFAPLAGVLCLTLLRFFLRWSTESSTSVVTRLLTLLLVLAPVAAVFGYGLHYSKDFTPCLGVGCVDPAKYHDKFQAGDGFPIVVGMSLWLAALGFMVAFGAAFLHNLSLRSQLDKASSSSGESFLAQAPVASVPYSVPRLWLAYLAFSVVIGLFAFTTTYIPNTWESFSPAAIAVFAAKPVDMDNGMIPEYPWAYFKTTTHEVKPYWIMKFFPSNIFFYLFIFLSSFLALVVRSVTFVRVLGRRKFIVRVMGESYSITLGETLMLAGVITLLTLWTYYWHHDHNFNNNYPGDRLSNPELAARTLGQLAVLLLSLLMFPAARDSVFSIAFNVSWEAGIKYHRMLGVSFLLVAIGHMAANYRWFVEVSEKPMEIFTIPMHVPFNVDNFTIPLMTIVFWFVLVTIGGLATFSFVRRRNFELFYYAHHAGFLALIPAVLLHASAAWEFLLPAVAVWFLDRCIRVYRSSTVVKLINANALDCGAAGPVTELQLSLPFSSYRPGQFCFVNVAEVSLLEWHPFTISSASSSQLTFHIKDMGSDTFTGRLYQRAVDQASLTVSVDGPYGLPPDFHNYSQVLLVAGGIGVTPVKAIFESLRSAPPPQLRVLHVVWIVRDPALLPIMAAALQGLPDMSSSQCQCSYSLFIDNPAANSNSIAMNNPVVPLVATVGRPNLSALLPPLVQENDKTLLFVCGPPGLTDSCESLANEQQWSFHTETFAL